MTSRGHSTLPPFGGRWVSYWRSPISCSSPYATREKSASSGTPKGFTRGAKQDSQPSLQFNSSFLVFMKRPPATSQSLKSSVDDHIAQASRRIASGFLKVVLIN